LSMRIWNYLQISWPMGGTMLDIVQGAKNSFGHPFFMEVALIACWNIWKVRNDKIFRAERPRFMTWKSRFVDDMYLHVYRFPDKFAPYLRACALVEKWPLVAGPEGLSSRF